MADNQLPNLFVHVSRASYRGMSCLVDSHHFTLISLLAEIEKEIQVLVAKLVYGRERKMNKQQNKTLLIQVTSWLLQFYFAEFYG